jgi:hypothetical protein
MISVRKIKKLAFFVILSDSEGSSPRDKSTDARRRRCFAIAQHDKSFGEFSSSEQLWDNSNKGGNGKSRLISKLHRYCPKTPI